MGGYDIFTTPSAAERVTVGAGQDLTSVDFLLPTRGEVSGRVLDETGAPARGARSSFWFEQRCYLAFTFATSHKSSYSISPLAHVLADQHA